MVVEQQTISAETFWELLQKPEYADKSWELVEGEIVEMVKPGGKHGQITGNIFGFLWNYVRENKLGYVTAAETGYILKKNPKGKDTVRGLDVGYISKERAPKGLPEKHIPFAPDLAVEVISQGNSAEDIHNKILELFDAGAKLVWIVYPSSQSVVVHTGKKSITLEIDDTLTGGDALPGFELSVREIFAE